MAVYEYVDDVSGRTIEREFPMSGETPWTVEEDGCLFRRVLGNTVVKIPDGWGENRRKYDGAPSGRKHLY